MIKNAGLPIIHIDNDITDDRKRFMVELLAVIFLCLAKIMKLPSVFVKKIIRLFLNYP